MFFLELIAQRSIERGNNKKFADNLIKVFNEHNRRAAQAPKKIYFKNMLVKDSEYEELSQIHTPKKMFQIISKKSEYGALPT